MRINEEKFYLRASSRNGGRGSSDDDAARAEVEMTRNVCAMSR